MSDFTRLDMANARIRVLESIVKTLPRTADNEIITIGSTIYRVYEGRTSRGSRYICEETVQIIGRNGHLETEESGDGTGAYSKVYSSRDMAEAHIARGDRIKFKPIRKAR